MSAIDDGATLADLVDVAKVRELIEPHGLRLVDSESVPAELFTLVVDALHCAHVELEQLKDTQIPWSDEELEQLKLAHDLREALSRAPEEWKPKLREIYQQAVADSVFREPGGPKPTVYPGTLESFEELWEQLRRAAITDPAVAEALRQSEAQL